MNAEYKYKVKASSPGRLKFIDEFNSSLRNHNISNNDINKLSLILDEIITNIISYGYSDKKQHFIDISAHVLSHTIQIVVMDDGIPFDPTNAITTDIASPLEKRSIGGLGIHFVKTFIDNMNYKHEGGKNILELIKKYRADKDDYMKIEKTLNESTATLTPQGRIDSITATAFDNAIVKMIESGKTKIIIDFSKTDFISSAGLRVLLMRAKQANHVQGKIVLCNMSKTIEEVFEVSGFSTIFSIFATLQDAINDLTTKPIQQ